MKKDILLKIFSHNWKTYFIWGLFIGVSHTFGLLIDWHNLFEKTSYFSFLNNDNNNFIATICAIYASLYIFGVPLIATLIEKVLKDFKTPLARKVVLENNQVNFFFNVTPIFIIYSISLLFFPVKSGIHILILFVIIIISFIRLYYLSKFYIKVLTDFQSVLVEEAKLKLKNLSHDFKKR